MMLMQFVRKSLLGLVASLLITVLLIFGLAFGLLKVFGSPGPIKAALKESGFYQTIVGNTLDLAQKSEKSEPGQDKIPVDQPEVKKIIENAASPAYLQSQTESTLDSVYDWLQGKKPKLDFAIDLADVKVRLANGVEQYVLQHLASLPACPRGTSSGNLDPFQAKCLPRGTNIKSVAAKAKNEILKGEFLKDSQLTAESIKTGPDGQQTLAQQLSNAPKIYQKVVQGIYLLGVLALLLATALVFISSSKRSGLKKLAIIFIIVGAASILLALISGYGVGRAGDTLVRNNPTQESAVRVAEILVGDLRNWWMGYGIILAVLGIGTLLTLRSIRPGTKAETKELDELPEETQPESWAKKLSEPEAKPKVKTAKKLVK